MSITLEMSEFTLGNRARRTNSHHSYPSNFLVWVDMERSGFIFLPAILIF